MSNMFFSTEILWSRLFLETLLIGRLKVNSHIDDRHDDRSNKSYSTTIIQTNLDIQPATS